MLAIIDILIYNSHLKSCFWNMADRSDIAVTVIDTETNNKSTLKCAELYNDFDGNLYDILGVSYLGDMTYKFIAVSDIFLSLLNYIDDIKPINLEYSDKNTVYNTDSFDIIRKSNMVVARLNYSYSVIDNLLIFSTKYKSCTLFDIIDSIIKVGVDLSSHPKIYIDILNQHKIYEVCYSDKMNLFITKSITLGRWQ